FTPVEAALAGIREIAEQCAEEDDRLHRTIREKVIPRTEGALALTDLNRRFQAVQTLEFKVGNVGRASAWPCGTDVARGRVKALTEAVAELHAAASEAVLRRLLILTARE